MNNEESNQMVHITNAHNGISLETHVLHILACKIYVVSQAYQDITTFRNAPIVEFNDWNKQMTNVFILCRENK